MLETPTETPIFKKHDIFVVKNISADSEGYTTKKYKRAIIHIRSVHYPDTEIPEMRVPRSVEYRFIHNDDGIYTASQSFDIKIKDLQIVRRLDMDMTGVGTYTKIIEKLKEEFAEYLI